MTRNGWEVRFRRPAVYAPVQPHNWTTLQDCILCIKRTRGTLRTTDYLPPSTRMALDFQTQPWVLWLSLALASIYTVQKIKRHTTHILPPGPKGLPFFGPMFHLSATPWKEFETWKGQYGKSTEFVTGRFCSYLTQLRFRSSGVHEHSGEKDARP